MHLTDDNKICIDLWKIIAHYGYSHQKEKAVEELGELQQALARDLQGEANRANIAEEMADVYIMLAQLQLIYGNVPDIANAVRLKLARTLDRVEAERTGNSPKGLASRREQGTGNRNGRGDTENGVYNPTNNPEWRQVRRE